MLYLFWVLNQNGGDTDFGVFFFKIEVQPHHAKDLSESFPMMWLNVGLS